MTNKVRSQQDIDEIYKAKLLVIQMAAKWLRLVKDHQNDRAARIRRKSNQIKREIQDKYDIIL